MSRNHEANPDTNILDERKSNGRVFIWLQVLLCCGPQTLLKACSDKTKPFPPDSLAVLNRGDRNLFCRCAVIFLHQIIGGVIVHGDVGTGKPKRIHWLQVCWTALLLRRAAVIDAIVRFYPSVDGCWAALTAGLMSSRDFGTCSTFLWMAWATSLVHKFLLWFWR